MTIITASDARRDDRDPRPEDQHRAEVLEQERARATVTPDAPIRTDGGDAGRDDLPQLHTQTRSRIARTRTRICSSMRCRPSPRANT
ncbi:hypothetical protein NJ7G_1778 [Natrinema sp. J7-2]|nr:hypothetical protein NJ7G_1778 [Natrinema sp. J7-2]